MTNLTPNNNSDATDKVRHAEEKDPHVADPHMERTQEEITESLTQYVWAIRNNKPELRRMWSMDALRDIQHPLAASEQIAEVLTVLLDEAEQSGPEAEETLFKQMDLVGIGGLVSQTCPPDILTRACRSKIQMYRYYAAQHQNCPEEAKIVAFLLGPDEPTLP